MEAGEGAASYPDHDYLASQRGALEASKAFLASHAWEVLKPCHTLEVRMPWWDSDARRAFEYVQVLGGDHSPYTPGMLAYKTLGDVLCYPGCNPQSLWLQVWQGEPSLVVWCGVNYATSRPPTQDEYRWFEVALRAVMAAVAHVRQLPDSFVPCELCVGIHELDTMETTLPVSPSFPFTTIQGDANDAAAPMLEARVRYPIRAWPYFCCFVCGAPANTRCPGCGTICYCTAEHQQQDWVGWHEPKCAVMRLQRAKAAVLRCHPFTFIHEISVLVDEFAFTAEDFLRSRGLHGRGIWKRTWGCLDFSHVPYGLLGDEPDAADWALPAAECPPLHPIDDLQEAQQVVDWPSYYRCRGLPFSSPVALVLHFPLTVLHVLRLLEARGTLDLSPGNEVRIHMVGVAQELDQRFAFQELANLLPGLTLRLAFIGHEISPLCHRRWYTCGSDRVAIVAFSGLYPDFVGEGCCSIQDPHLVMGLNSGLGAYPEWNPTVDFLLHGMQPPVPAFFSDYCEASCDVGKELLEQTFRTPLGFPVSTNPFRCPLSRRQRSLCTEYPEYGNGFLFGINV
eukprot:GGOE01014765.1.p1 GENE.GGOE01014765.1~~GGOE01014765.1.p1  ORF type:complete len:572 (-),score=170.10 GGOE01014765.1:387-2081(-)